MKIGIFTNNYLPNPYGVTGSIESFRIQLEKMGHEVFVFASSWKGYIDANPRVFRYPSVNIEIKFKFPLAIPYSRKMDKIIEQLDLDIIHAQHPNLLGTVAKKWARRKKIPLVFTWHTLYDQYAHFAPFFPKKLVVWWTIRQAVNYANQSDAVVAPTDSARKIIENWGVKNKNIFSIPTGVEEEQFINPDRKGIRQKLGIKENEIALLSNARLTEEKNMLFVFRSVADVLQKNKQVKFLVVGNGNLRGLLEKFCREKEIASQVIFAGEILREDRKDYYSAADIFVSGSKSETQGTVTTEVMYLGLPVVAINATGTKDLVENNANGFLVSEKEDEFSLAIERLIEDESLRQKMGAESARIAREKYTSQICANKMLAVYRRLRK